MAEKLYLRMREDALGPLNLQVCLLNHFEGLLAMADVNLSMVLEI